MGTWDGLEEQVAVLVERLRPIGREIGEAARNGDEQAQSVINAYTLLHRRMDPVAAMLTETALDNWQRSRSGGSPDNSPAK